jgi:hypothetical protein
MVDSAMSTPEEVKALAKAKETLRAEKAKAWDECVRAVANVDPKAIHNPYRSE